MASHEPSVASPPLPVEQTSVGLISQLAGSSGNITSALQKHHEEWKLVQAGFPTSIGTCCAVIEVELLAVAWAAKKCRIFLSGLPTFTVITDHSRKTPRGPSRHNQVKGESSAHRLLIKMYIADCKLCQDSLPSHPREIVTKPYPSRPFQGTMDASTSSWWLIALLTGPTSSRRVLIP
jgi:hypothetical protein